MKISKINNQNSPKQQNTQPNFKSILRVNMQNANKLSTPNKIFIIDNIAGILGTALGAKKIQFTSGIPSSSVANLILPNAQIHTFQWLKSHLNLVTKGKFENDYPAHFYSLSQVENEKDNFWMFTDEHSDALTKINKFKSQIAIVKNASAISSSFIKSYREVMDKNDRKMWANLSLFLGHKQFVDNTVIKDTPIIPIDAGFKLQA